MEIILGVPFSMIHCRVDDFPGTKPEEFWRHNRENYLKFHEILIRAFPTYRLGVIPKHTTIDDLKFLGGLKGLEIALHGINHDERFPNEFREHQTQADIWEALKGALHPIPFYARRWVFSYIPPHNVIDVKTIKVLSESNIFSQLHTGPGTAPEMIGIAQQAGLIVHDTRDPREYGRTDEMMERGCFPYLNEEGKKRDFYITLHWTWEFNIGLQSLETFVREIK